MLGTVALAVFVCAMLAFYLIRVRQKHEAHDAMWGVGTKEHDMKVSAPALWQDLKSNGAAAQARYAGQTLMVAARVDSLLPMEGGTTLVLLHTDDGTRTLQAMMQPGAGAAPAAGSKVVLHCEALTTNMGEPALSNCVVVG